MQIIKLRIFINSIIFTCLLALNNNCLAQQHITTLQLQNTQPELLLPAIKAQLSPGSSASVYKNTLVLNVTDKELQAIRQIIEQLDSPGKQLLISLKTAGNNGSDNKQTEVSYQRQGNPTIHIGNSNINANNHSNNNPNNNPNNKIVANTRTTATTITTKQQTISQYGSTENGVRATEGSPAYIGTGNTLILSNKQVYSDGKQTINQQPVDTNSGFYATAWLNGDNVTVKIDQRQQRFENTTTINHQQLQTQVSGRLGEWIPIGGIVEYSNRSNHQLNSRNNDNLHDATLLAIKIELLVDH